MFTLKSKQSIILYFLFILVLVGSSILLFIAYIIIDVNKESLFRADVIFGILFIMWISLFPIILLANTLKRISIDDERITVADMFGLFKSSYQLEDLIYNDYLWGSHGLIIGKQNGEQFTIGSKQYKNYNDLRIQIQNKIRKDNNLKLKKINRTLRAMIGVGIVILVMLIVSIQIN